MTSLGCSATATAAAAAAAAAALIITTTLRSKWTATAILKYPDQTTATRRGMLLARCIAVRPTIVVGRRRHLLQKENRARATAFTGG